MSASNIAEAQNSAKEMERLAAFTRLYGHAKTILTIQFILTVPATLVTASLAAVEPKAKIWTTFYAITVALIDALILERVQAHFKRLAACIQEQFDCELFQLPWNALRAGSKPDSEDVQQAATKHRRKTGDTSNLRDWYPPVVAEVRVEFARLICQRAACWWDSNLRTNYANGLIALLVLIFLSVVGISLCNGLKVAEMLLTVYVPIAPAVLWSVREVRKQREAADSLDKLRTHVEKIWTEVMSSSQTTEELTNESRRIQDSLFDGRSRNPLIFNWIYRCLRKENEVSMNVKASELVAETRAVVGKP